MFTSKVGVFFTLLFYLCFKLYDFFPYTFKNWLDFLAGWIFILEDLVEFKDVIKKLICFRSPLQWILVFKIKTSLAYENMRDLLGYFVITISQFERLEGWAWNNFNLGILAFEVVESLWDLDGESLYIKSLCKSLG